MGYDVFLQRFRDGEEAVVSGPAVWGLLKAVWDEPPDENDFARLTRGSGEADLYAAPEGSMIDGLMFSRPAGEEILDLIVEAPERATW